VGIRVTGVSFPGFGVQWQKTSTDKEIARRLIHFMEDRRLLFGQVHIENEIYCIQSAIEIRNYLTRLLDDAKPGKELANSIRVMRAACRRFVENGGPNAENYVIRFTGDPFGLALGDLRTMVGVHVAQLSYAFDLEVEEDLASILPPNPDDDDGDIGWLPGSWEYSEQAFRRIQYREYPGRRAGDSGHGKE
jgi:hypothetical protein